MKIVKHEFKNLDISDLLLPVDDSIILNLSKFAFILKKC